MLSTLKSNGRALNGMERDVVQHIRKSPGDKVLKTRAETVISFALPS